MHTELCKARTNNLLFISSKPSYPELIRKTILWVFFILYTLLSTLLPHWFVIFCFWFVSCTLPMILNPVCTLKSLRAFFKKFKCPDIPSSNSDFIGLRWKLGATFLKPSQVLMTSDLSWVCIPPPSSSWSLIRKWYPWLLNTFINLFLKRQIALISCNGEHLKSHF